MRSYRVKKQYGKYQKKEYYDSMFVYMFEYEDIWYALIRLTKSIRSLLNLGPCYPALKCICFTPRDLAAFIRKFSKKAER